MNPHREKLIIDAITQFSDGATAKQISDVTKLGINATRQSLHWLYWAVPRRIEREKLCKDRTEYLYRLKLEAPPVAPAAWDNPRMAERETEGA